MTRVIVTGGAGFIGRHVVGLLRSAGDKVTLLDLQTGCDARDIAAMRKALDGAHVLVHLAAKVGLGVDLDDIDDYVSNNDLGTAVTLRAAASAGVGHAVVASSMVVYGEGAYRCAEHGAVTAASRTAGDLRAGHFDPRNAYAAAKEQTEFLTRVWTRETGASATALRFHNVYGPGMPRNTP